MRYLLTLACCPVLTACGKSDKKDLSGDAKPLYGGTLIYAKSGHPLTLDPALTKETESSVVLANLFDGLVRNAPVKRPSIPALPIPWEIFKDTTIYTFHLRSGVIFHNGAEQCVQKSLRSIQSRSAVVYPCTLSNGGYDERNRHGIPIAFHVSQKIQ